MKTQWIRTGVRWVAWVGFLYGVAGKGFAQSEVQIVAAWDFNQSGLLEVSQGRGTLQLVGGVSVTNFLGTASDPAKPNGAIGLKGFPPQGMSPQSAGLEFTIPVRGWSLHGLAFEVRASGTASRRVRVLATGGDGGFETLGFHDLRQDGVFEKVNLDLTGRTDWTGLAEIRIRVVSDFDESGSYTGVKPKADGANSYSAAGTWRVDLFTVTGVPEVSPGGSLALRLSASTEDLGLDWEGAPGAVFTVWESLSPDGPWEPVASGTDLTHHQSSVGGARRFFRVTSP